MKIATENNRSDSKTAAVETFDGKLVLVAGAIVVLFHWLLPMVSGLWIDELGTFWVIDGDLGSTIDRAWRFHGQTPLYYSVLWIATKLLGTSEFAMRLPSLVFMATAGFVLYKMSRRMFGREAALLTAVGFLVIPAIASAGGDARPYALAILAAVVATDVLDRWHRNPRISWAVAYGVAAAFVVYSHYVFSTILVAHLVYHVWRVRAEPVRWWRQTAIAVGTFVAVLAPTLPQISALLGRKDELTFSSTPAFDDLIAIWSVPILITALLGAVIWRMSRGNKPLPRLQADPLVLVGLGFVVPPVALFVMGNLTDVVLWTRRYWMVAFPFGAVVFGAVLASLLENRQRALRGALIILTLSLLSTSTFQHSVEDWRGAAAAANRLVQDPSTPVLLYANLIEASNPEFFEDAERRSYLSSPTRYYPIAGSVTPIPWAFPTIDYPERISPYLEPLTSLPRVVLVTNRSGGATSTAYISGRLLAEGYSITSQSSHGLVMVTAFER